MDDCKEKMTGELDRGKDKKIVEEKPKEISEIEIKLSIAHSFNRIAGTLDKLVSLISDEMEKGEK